MHTVLLPVVSVLDKEQIEARTDCADITYRYVVEAAATSRGGNETNNCFQCGRPECNRA